MWKEEVEGFFIFACVGGGDKILDVSIVGLQSR